MSIELRQVTKTYEEQAVVDRVTVQIANGEFFVLLGPSGSGKSTLLRMIAGLEEVNAGSIHFSGVDMTHISARERGLGFVFQNYVLFKHMTVEQNIGFALKLRNLPKAQIRERCASLLEMVGLAGYGNRFPRQLSGGQQQRVALARALAAEPKILLLDEPFGALDAKIRSELRQHLRRIQRELGLTAILVTHDQEEAFELADRIAVMHRGRMLEVGQPRDLYLWPRTQFVATFLGAANLLIGESMARAVRLGPLEFPLASDSTDSRRPRRLQVLFRPEDVRLSKERPARTLGEAKVVDRVFLGAHEQLRLSLTDLKAVRAVMPPTPFGSDEILVDARRAQHETSHLPLSPGDMVHVALERVHVLAPATLRLLVEAGNSPHARAAYSLGLNLTRALDAEMSRLGGSDAQDAHGVLPAMDDEDGVVDEGYDIAVLGLRPKQPLASPNLSLIRHHLLLVPGPAEVPRHLLICVAVGEPGKVDVRFAERFAWQLGAQATVMTVVPEDQQPVPEHVSLFLEAARRALSRRGVTTHGLVRQGTLIEQIRAALAEGQYDLLVVGAPGPDQKRGAVDELFFEPPPCPILMVRHV